MLNSTREVELIAELNSGTTVELGKNVDSEALSVGMTKENDDSTYTELDRDSTVDDKIVSTVEAGKVSVENSNELGITLNSETESEDDDTISDAGTERGMTELSTEVLDKPSLENEVSTAELSTDVGRTRLEASLLETMELKAKFDSKGVKVETSMTEVTISTDVIETETEVAKVDVSKVELERSKIVDVLRYSEDATEDAGDDAAMLELSGTPLLERIPDDSEGKADDSKTEIWVDAAALELVSDANDLTEFVSTLSVLLRSILEAGGEDSTEDVEMGKPLEEGSNEDPKLDSSVGDGSEEETASLENSDTDADGATVSVLNCGASVLEASVDSNAENDDSMSKETALGENSAVETNALDANALLSAVELEPMISELEYGSINDWEVCSDV